MFNIANIHYITQGDIPGFSHAELAEQACEGGVDWVQLRVKDLPAEEVEKIAAETLMVCRKHGAKMIINDFPEVAKATGADGVHLGKTDMSPVEARKLLGEQMIIGGTANTFEDIVGLAEAKVNYIGLGPFRFTTTKKNLSPVVGLEGYKGVINKCLLQKIDIPIIAIGGILPEDIDSLLEAGLSGIAISSAVNKSENKPKAMESFIDAMDVAKNKTSKGV